MISRVHGSVVRTPYATGNICKSWVGIDKGRFDLKCCIFIHSVTMNYMYNLKPAQSNLPYPLNLIG